MAEYIKREALCYQLEKQATIDGQPRAIRRAARIVANFPAADVRPVVHGRWIERTHKLYDGEIGYSIECESCHEVFTEISLTIKPTKRNFCSNCGAKMEVQE